MIPEPWSIDDLSPEEYAEWEAQQDIEWQANPDRPFWEERDAIVAAGKVIPDWVDGENDERSDKQKDADQRAALAIARWRMEQGHQLSSYDMGLLSAALSGKLLTLSNGAPLVGVSPLKRRERELEAAYLLDELKLTKVNAAALMERGIDKENIIGLAAGGRAKGFELYNVRRHDEKLKKQIIAKHERGQKEAKTDARKAAQYTPNKRPRR